MGLLAPLFLLGLLVIALPLWLHRMNFSDPPSQPFSSVRLMRHSEQTASTEQELRYWLLLACRILALVLLVLLFAEPVFRSNSPLLAGAEQKHNLIVVDQSLSMSAPNVWQEAIDNAELFIEAMENNETAQVIGASSDTEILTDITADKAELRQALARLEPGYATLDYGQVVEAMDEFASNIETPTNIYFVSDIQASNLPIRFSDLVPSRATGLQLDIAQNQNNTQVQPLNWAVTANYDRNRVSANLIGYGTPARQIQLDLLINGELKASQNVDVPASGSAIAQFEELNLALDETHIEVALNLGNSDALDADNSYYISSNSLDALKVLILAADPSLEDSVFLDTAFNSIANPRTQAEVFYAGGQANFALDDFDLVVINDAASLSVNISSALDAFAQRGGNLLLVAGPASHVAGEIQFTGHQFDTNNTGFASNEAQGVIVQQPLHGSVSQFDGVINSQLYQIRQLQTLEGDQIIASTNNGYPWLVEHSMGLGKALILSHSLMPEATDLSLAPEFVPLLRSWANYLGGSGELPNQYVTGDQIQAGVDLNGNRATQVQQVFLPDGSPMLSLSQQAQVQRVTFETPGIYGLQTARGEHLVAVNTPDTESDLAPISDQLVAQWRNLAAEANTPENLAENSIQSSSITRLLSIEDWLLPLLLLIILAESVLGNAHLKVRREISR